MDKRMSATHRDRSMVNSVDEKIFARMWDLQDMMEAQVHLSDPRAVLEKIASISKFWERLEEQDRDYIEGCRFALDSLVEWKP